MIPFAIVLLTLGWLAFMGFLVHKKVDGFVIFLWFLATGCMLEEVCKQLVSLK